MRHNLLAVRRWWNGGNVIAGISWYGSRRVGGHLWNILNRRAIGVGGHFRHILKLLPIQGNRLAVYPRLFVDGSIRPIKPYKTLYYLLSVHLQYIPHHFSFHF